MPKPKPKPAEELPYDETTCDGWLATVNRWPWKEIEPRHWRKSGKCPRCRHDMHREVRPVVVRLFDRGPSSIPPLRVDVLCNCTVVHPQRPDNRVGCGSAGEFDGPRSRLEGPRHVDVR